jgi:hypothetical protein
MTTPTKRVPDHAHGNNGYSNYGCRCGTCREARRVYQQDYRARLATTDPVAIPHGTTNAYDNFGCRCDECCLAKAESRRRGDQS